MAENSVDEEEYSKSPVECEKNLVPSSSSSQSSSIWESGSASSESPAKKFKVYLRLKPFSDKSKLNRRELNAYSITNSSTLITKIPRPNVLTKGIITRPLTVDFTCRRYTFTEIFSPATTQREFFNHVVEDKMQEFLTGSNATIMTYGTSKSGKTFTLLGGPSLPGIIPRCLEWLFSKINTNPVPSYKPLGNNTIKSLSISEGSDEVNFIFELLLLDVNGKIWTKYDKMQKILESERFTQEIDADKNVHYAVWLSYAEIYNDLIYDLLSNNPKPLELLMDNNGVSYIDGLTSAYVTSGSKALRVLLSRPVINTHKSDGHRIITIKLLKYHEENKPESVRPSTLSFCELADSDRLEKTLNPGSIMIDAQNVDTSLFILGQCLKLIHKGQPIWPFRLSKLTQLYQEPLLGTESIALIVNINRRPAFYAETQNVLSVTAITEQILPDTKKTIFGKRMSVNKIKFDSIVGDNNGEIQWKDYEKLLSDIEPLANRRIKLHVLASRGQSHIYDEALKIYDKVMEYMEQKLRDAPVPELNLYNEFMKRTESQHRLDEAVEDSPNIEKEDIDKTKELSDLKDKIKILDSAVIIQSLDIAMCREENECLCETVELYKTKLDTLLELNVNLQTTVLRLDKQLAKSTAELKSLYAEQKNDRIQQQMDEMAIKGEAELLNIDTDSN